MKLGCMASLQGGGCEMSKAWAFGLDGDYVYVAKKGERLVATKKYLLLPEVYVGVIRDREAIGVLTSNLKSCMHFGIWLLVLLHSTAAECRCKVLECC